MLQPLPPAATRRPLPVRRLLAVSGAPSRHELAGPLWTRPHRGVVAWSALDAGTPGQRVLAAAAALPGTPLGGWAAALVHGAVDLDGATSAGAPLPVLFCPGRSGARRRRRGLVPLRSALAPHDVVEVRGLLVTSPLRTAFDLARTAGDLAQAVADVDALLRVRPAVLEHDELARYVAAHPGSRGVPLARRAVALADAGARSRPESRLRVLWTVDAGLTRPLVNPEVAVRGSGRLAGIPDLLDPVTGLVGEYDGAQHRDLGHHTRDNVREERFEDLGLTVVRATSQDLAQPASLVRRLLAGQRRAQEQTRRNWYVR